MKRDPDNLIALVGLVYCVHDLITSEAMILLGHGDWVTTNVIYPICKYLVRIFSPLGTDLSNAMNYWFAWVWFVGCIIFFLAFWECNKSSAKNGKGKQMALLTVQIVTALIFQGKLTNAIAPQLAYRLPLRTALWWLAGLVMLSWLSATPYLLGLFGLRQAGSIVKWHLPIVILRNELIYFTMGYLALIATKHRKQLAATNIDLMESRQLLGEAVRSSERLRITHELHESIGHLLTKLNLHLDIAIKQGGDRMAASIHTAAELGKQLLANVLLTVSNERGGRVIDLRQALQTLCTGVPHPRIELDIADGFETDTPKIAYSLFCCTQEAITNAVRHANAKTLAISLTRSVHEIALRIEDDGQGMRNHQEGNGFHGMRERVAAHHGSITVADSSAGHGCLIDIRIPLFGELA